MAASPEATSDARIKRCCNAFWGAIQAGAAADPPLLDLFTRAVIAAAADGHSFEAVLQDGVRAWQEAARSIRAASEILPAPELHNAATALTSQIDHLCLQTNEVLATVATMGPVSAPQEDAIRQSAVSEATPRRAAEDLELVFETPPTRMLPPPASLEATARQGINFEDSSPEHADGTPASSVPPGEAPGLVLACPRCGTRCRVRWNRLQERRILQCPECTCHFFASRCGTLNEVVRRRGQWVERHVDAERTMQRRQFIAGGTGAVAALLALGWLWKRTADSRDGQPLDDLPKSLEDRAKLFAEAWIKGDARVIARLTDPTMTRSLFLWKRRHPKPSATAPIRVDIELVSGSGAIVLIAWDTASAVPVRELKTSWIRRDGTWMFQPITVRQS